MNFPKEPIAETPRPRRGRLFRILRRTAIAVVALVLSIVLVIATAESLVTSAASDRLFEDASSVPKADVALLLGVAKFTPDGRRNVFYEARIDAAAALYETGRVRGILVSGDNSRPDYDEPTQMREDLIARGIPAEFITRDAAGLRTLDSIVRAKEVFGQSRVIVVSQSFHAERALFLADRFGLEADALTARDARSERWQKKNRRRESLARVKALLDAVLGTRPKHLGEPQSVALRP